MLVARDNRSGVSTVHYLPEGETVRAMGFPIERSGNAVYVHLSNHSIKLESPGSVNLTDVVITLLPLERLFETPEPLRTVYDLEALAFDEHLSTNVRRIVRLYAALLGIKNIDKIPDTVKDGILLTVSRLTGLSPEEIVANRSEIEKVLERELERALRTASPEELARVLSAAGVLG